MSGFTDRERAYLEERVPARLARVATVGADGTPHVVPVGWRFNPKLDAIEISGHGLEHTKKYRDAQRSGRAAAVIDDLASTDPWRPRGIEVRGRAETTSGDPPLLRIYPERIVSWGIESDELGKRHSRAA